MRYVIQLNCNTFFCVSADNLLSFCKKKNSFTKFVIKLFLTGRTLFFHSLQSLLLEVFLELLVPLFRHPCHSVVLM